MGNLIWLFIYFTLELSCKFYWQLYNDHRPRRQREGFYRYLLFKPEKSLGKSIKLHAEEEERKECGVGKLSLECV